MRARYIVAAALALLPTIASASETVTYSYDAKGRLTNVTHAGGPQNGAATAYVFDAADNRTSITTTGVTQTSGPGVVVHPLNSLLIMLPLSAILAALQPK